MRDSVKVWIFEYGVEIILIAVLVVVFTVAILHMKEPHPSLDKSLILVDGHYYLVDDGTHSGNCICHRPVAESCTKCGALLRRSP